MVAKYFTVCLLFVSFYLKSQSSLGNNLSKYSMVEVKVLTEETKFNNNVKKISYDNVKNYILNQFDSNNIPYNKTDSLTFPILEILIFSSSEDYDGDWNKAKCYEIDFTVVNSLNNRNYISWQKMLTTTVINSNGDILARSLWSCIYKLTDVFISDWKKSHP